MPYHPDHFLRPRPLNARQKLMFFTLGCVLGRRPRRDGSLRRILARATAARRQRVLELARAGFALWREGSPARPVGMYCLGLWNTSRPVHPEDGDRVRWICGQHFLCPWCWFRTRCLNSYRALIRCKRPGCKVWVPPPLAFARLEEVCATRSAWARWRRAGALGLLACARPRWSRFSGWFWERRHLVLLGPGVDLPSTPGQPFHMNLEPLARAVALAFSYPEELWQRPAAEALALLGGVKPRAHLWRGVGCFRGSCETGAPALH